MNSGDHIGSLKCGIFIYLDCAEYEGRFWNRDTHRPVFRVIYPVGFVQVVVQGRERAVRELFEFFLFPAISQFPCTAPGYASCQCTGYPWDWLVYVSVIANLGLLIQSHHCHFWRWLIGNE